MTRSKAPSKKKHGVDFKKIKRKIGRKLPPPKNSRNTEIKSNYFSYYFFLDFSIAIILPEQSVASEKAGLAVNKKGLTLKELLQQSSHHNPKVRRAPKIQRCIGGYQGTVHQTSTELKLHKHSVVEKLHELIGDDVKVIFKAMTHLANNIRLKAFKFLDLVLEFYPPSLPSYAEKIFQNYDDILRKNQCYLQDKGKLKIALVGLVRCLSLFPWNERETDLHDKNDAGQRVLHAFEDDVPARSTDKDFLLS